MAFDKETGKQAGKKSKRGTDTQLRELRSIYADLLQSNTDKIQVWFDKVAKDEPVKALDLMLKFSSFIIPKPRSIEVNIKEDEIKQTDYSKWSDEDLHTMIELGKQQNEIEAKYK